MSTGVPFQPAGDKCAEKPDVAVLCGVFATVFSPQMLPFGNIPLAKLTLCQKDITFRMEVARQALLAYHQPNQGIPSCHG